MRLTRLTTLPAIALLAAMAFTNMPPPAQAEGPPSVRAERQAHPRLVRAIEEMKATLRDLERAPDDFGGNKAAAMEDLRRGIHSLKRALYFRLRMDDAAIDRLD